jgi:hypothetical protein
MSRIPTVAKAIAAAIAAGGTALATAIPDGVSAGDWVKVVTAALVAGVVTWAAPANKPRAGRRPAE